MLVDLIDICLFHKLTHPVALPVTNIKKRATSNPEAFGDFDMGCCVVLDDLFIKILFIFVLIFLVRCSRTHGAKNTYEKQKS